MSIKLIPHFYISKLGYAGAYLFFLFLLLNIDCGYSLKLVKNFELKYLKYLLFIPPAKRSFRGVYCFQPVCDSVIPSTF